MYRENRQISSNHVLTIGHQPYINLSNYMADEPGKFELIMYHNGKEHFTTRKVFFWVLALLMHFG